MKTVVAIFVAAMSACWFSVCVASAPPDGRTIVTQECRACHALKRSCRALGTRDKHEWLETVNRMVGYGLDLDSGRAEAAAEFLAGAPKGDPVICE